MLACQGGLCSASGEMTAFSASTEDQSLNVGVRGPRIGHVLPLGVPDQRLEATDWPARVYPFSTTSREYGINFASLRT
jgi:hypothetical protein